MGDNRLVYVQQVVAHLHLTGLSYSLKLQIVVFEIVKMVMEMAFGGEAGM